MFEKNRVRVAGIEWIDWEKSPYISESSHKLFLIKWTTSPEVFHRVTKALWSNYTCSFCRFGKWSKFCQKAMAGGRPTIGSRWLLCFQDISTHTHSTTIYTRLPVQSMGGPSLDHKTTTCPMRRTRWWGEEEEEEEEQEEGGSPAKLLLILYREHSTHQKCISGLQAF